MKLSDWIKTVKCSKIIQNEDNLCALKAILLAKAYFDKEPNAYKLNDDHFVTSRVNQYFLKIQDLLNNNRFTKDKYSLEEIKV